MQNIHPYFVHFPIALISVGFLWDILGTLFKKEALKNAGFWAQIFGVIGIILTAITGLIAEQTVPHSDVSHEIMETHKTFELIVAGIFILLLIWRIVQKTTIFSKPLMQTIYFSLGILSVLAMLYGAHLGGKLVYEFGVGGSAVQQQTHSHQHDRSDEENNDQHEHEGEFEYQH